MQGGTEQEGRTTLGRANERAGEELAHHHLVRRVRDAICCYLPFGATILVATEGDDDYLRLLRGRRAGPLPPENLRQGADAVERGDFLVIPEPAQEWLNRHPELERHLERHAERIVEEPDTCVIFALSEWPARAPGQDREPHCSELHPIRTVSPAAVIPDSCLVDPDPVLAAVDRLDQERWLRCLPLRFDRADRTEDVNTGTSTRDLEIDLPAQVDQAEPDAADRNDQGSAHAT